MTKNVLSTDLVCQKSGNIVSDMDGEKVMLSISNSKYYNLGKTGGVIWETIETPIVVTKLIHLLVSQFDVEYTVCEEEVLSFLSQLNKEDLIVVKESSEALNLNSKGTV
jgi:hypothetical protein